MIKELDCTKLVANIRDMMTEIEENLEVRIQNDAQVGILIHVSFLIDKLKHGGKEAVFKNLDEYKYKHNKEFMLIKKGLRFLEQIYEISIGDDELAYIVRMVRENIITV